MRDYVGKKVILCRTTDNYFSIVFEDLSEIKVFVDHKNKISTAEVRVAKTSPRHEDDDDIEWVESSKYGIRNSSSQFFYPNIPCDDKDLVNQYEYDKQYN